MKQIKALLILALILSLVGKIYSQDRNKHKGHMSNAGDAKDQKAVCQLSPASGSNVTGTVTFTKVKEGIKVVADIQGLTPGKHGFHIHEKGDCSAPDASSAGGHFNPAGGTHGGPPDMMRHAGDLGNLEADKSGKAHYEYTDLMLSFDGENSIVGKSVIVHAKTDDLITQPAGNSGSRVACGVIQMSE